MHRTALIPLACVGLALLAGCPGSLENPERFTDAGGVDGGGGTGCDVEETIFKGSCGGAGCHEAPNPANNLDLVSPGVKARVAAQASTCSPLSMADNVLNKVKPNPMCGSLMPLGATATSGALTAAQVQCVAEWVASLDGGTP